MLIVLVVYFSCQVISRTLLYYRLHVLFNNSKTLLVNKVAQNNCSNCKSTVTLQKRPQVQVVTKKLVS